VVFCFTHLLRYTLPMSSLLAPSIIQKMQKQDEQIIAVDSHDTPLHAVEKIAAHRAPGTLHRAITVNLINAKGEWLLTQRSASKPLWPLWWDMACSTHPWWPDEDAITTSARRVPFEIGIPWETVRGARDLFAYEYHAVYSAEWAENEINHIVVGECDLDPTPNPDEVAEWRWATPESIAEELSQPGHAFAPWFEPAFEKLSSRATLQR
jgi:isopentenyl-diphosphate Delta-isomerase